MKVEKKSYYHRSSVENTLAQMPRYKPTLVDMVNIKPKENQIGQNRKKI